MRKRSTLNRRQFLQFLGITAFAAASFPPFLSAESTRAPNKAAPNFHPDVDIDLTAREASVPIWPGQETRVMKYHANLVKGLEGTVKPITGSYLGPIFNLKVGQKVRINFHNGLAERSIVHWHGLHLPQNMDGHPMYEIAPGETYVYEFEIRGRAGTFWYHSHAHERTAEQVYQGLAGLVLVSDGEEQGLRLPDGVYDLPLVIQDRRFDGQNQLTYLDSPHERMRGFLGDHILVNGQPNFTLPVSTRAYRLRLLNGSNSRIYKLAWSDGMPMTVIGTDGGLLEEPVTRSYITLAPAERIELWADFSQRRVGDELVLRSLAFTGAAHIMPGGMMGGGAHDMGRMEHGGHAMPEGGGMGHGMMEGGMGGMMPPDRLPLGSEFPVLKVRVEAAVNDDHRLPQRLSTIQRYEINEAENPKSPRVIQLRMEHMRWTLNGRTFVLEEATPDEHIRLNTLQLIEFDNWHGGGHMMHLAHPMHFHEQPFQVVKREIDPALKEAYASLSSGFIDEGWKDTVLVMPGEKVTLLKRFDDFKGLYLYHCHNLEHEDMGMMRNFLIN